MQSKWANTLLFGSLIMAAVMTGPMAARSSDFGSQTATSGAASAQLVLTSGIESPAEIFDRGMRAFKAQDFAAALSDLERAAAFGEFRAQFNLARIYEQGLTGYADHVRAFAHYRQIADRYAGIDPFHNKLAPYVAYAHMAVGLYLRSGLPANGVEADRDGALTYLERAASYFGHDDAQLELAKTLLSETADGRSIDTGLHHLSKLAYGRGNSAAQAVLGDLFWSGRFVDHRPAMGLALLALAVSNAPEHERAWVENLYQRMFCESRSDERVEAMELAHQFSRRIEVNANRVKEERASFGLIARAKMSCANGEAVDIPSFPHLRGGLLTEQPTTPGDAIRASGADGSLEANASRAAEPKSPQSGSMMSLGGAVPR